MKTAELRKQASSRRLSRRGFLQLAAMAGLGGGAFALVGCGGSDGGGGSSSSSGSSGSSSSSGSGGPEDFSIVYYQGEGVIGGNQVNFSSLLGKGKPVVLNFWAGACPPCRAEMPALQRIYEENAGAFTLIGVDIGPFVNLGSQDDARRLLQELGVTYPTAYATNADPVRSNRIQAMPTTLFYDGSGQRVSKHTGFITEDQFRAAVAALIAGQS